MTAPQRIENTVRISDFLRIFVGQLLILEGARSLVTQVTVLLLSSEYQPASMHLEKFFITDIVILNLVYVKYTPLSPLHGVWSGQASDLGDF